MKTYRVNYSIIAIFFIALFSINAVTCQESDSAHNQIEHYNKLGKEKYKQGKFIEALENFDVALKIAQDINDSFYIAKLNSNSGVMHDMIGNYAEAISHYQKSLSIYDRIDNSQGKESVCNNMGVVYEELNMPEKALSYYFMALDIAKSNNNKEKVGGTYNNIAIIYENYLDKSDSAQYYYDKALECFIELGDEVRIALVKCNMGIILLRRGMPEKAREYIDQSLELFQHTGTRADYADALFFKGKLCLEEQKYDEALSYYEQALELADKFKIKKRQSSILSDMAEVYKKQKKYKQALEAFERHTGIKDELMDLEKVRQISKLEMDFNREKREYETELVNKQSEFRIKELEWTKRLLYSVLIIIVLITIVSVMLWNRSKLKQDQELLLLQSRLFRSQTNPHFIFNSLMSIQTFLMEGNIKSASKYLVDFAKLMRSVLANSQKSLVPLSQEIVFLKQYLGLEELRFGDKFDVEFKVNVPFPEEIEFPPMLAQPFIENAIIHGLLPANKKGLLKVEFYKDSKVFFLVIEDDGVGRGDSALKKEDKNHTSSKF